MLSKVKAVEIADALLPAFNTPTGIPFSFVNVRTGVGRNWMRDGTSILSDMGSLHMELAYLSDITGNPVYRQKAISSKFAAVGIL